MLLKRFWNLFTVFICSWCQNFILFYLNNSFTFKWLEAYTKYVFQVIIYQQIKFNLSIYAVWFFKHNCNFYYNFINFFLDFIEILNYILYYYSIHEKKQFRYCTLLFVTASPSPCSTVELDPPNLLRSTSKTSSFSKYSLMSKPVEILNTHTPNFMSNPD